MLVVLRDLELDIYTGVAKEGPTTEGNGVGEAFFFSEIMMTWIHQWRGKFRNFSPYHDSDGKLKESKSRLGTLGTAAGFDMMNISNLWKLQEEPHLMENHYRDITGLSLAVPLARGFVEESLELEWMPFML